MSEYQKWIQQIKNFRFKGFGYGKFATGIPCSYQFRGQIKRKK